MSLMAMQVVKIQRFAAIVSETPARYVARVRMHQARQWLTHERAIL